MISMSDQYTPDGVVIGISTGVREGGRPARVLILGVPLEMIAMVIASIIVLMLLLEQ